MTKPHLNRTLAQLRLLVVVAMVTSFAFLPAGAEELDPRLRYLLHACTALDRGPPGDLLRAHAAPTLGEAAAQRSVAGHRATAHALRLLAEDRVPGSIRFAQPPDAATLQALRDLGVRFSDFGAGPAGSRTVYPVRIPWEALRAVADHASVKHIACAWRIAARAPLAVSRPQVEADAMWELDDLQGRPLTGTGTLIADFDTGVDYFHPSLFFADGDTTVWIDVDESGDLTMGDAVDVNANGEPDPGESLCYYEGTGADHYGNDSGVYDTGFDWLYNDANDSATREYGASFGESQPGYGELLFVTLDADGDGRLDPGELLVTLKTSKIRAIRGRDGVVYERGDDLLPAALDWAGHGTSVSGIACGGWAGINHMSGVAPGAEMIHAVNDYIGEPPFLVPMEEHLAWAATFDPDVFLIEDGEWVWEFMDGSSNVETMLNEFAADQDILQVIPAGNLAAGNMHAFFAAEDGITLRITDHAAVCWLDFLWIDESSLAVTLTVPGEVEDVLALDGSTQVIGGYEIYSLVSVSPRGTRRIDLRIEHEIPGTSLDGNYAFAFDAGRAARQTNIHGFFSNDRSGWFSASHWSEVDARFTVTWPATADSAMSVAAYDPEGDSHINYYSGTGPRIDGRPDVDIAAPGSTVYSICAFNPGAYTPFGGTSAAGPHVAGAAALLRQLIPEMDSGRFRDMIHGGAQTDEYTGDFHRSGAGKLRILRSLEYVAGVVESPPFARPLLSLDAVPNPATSGTTLRFYTPQGGSARLSVVDVTGRIVFDRVAEALPGHQTFVWDGRDLPAGVYWARVSQGTLRATTRVLLIR